MQLKKMAVVFTCLLLVASLLAGCGGSQSGSQSLPTIRFLADDSEAAKKYAQGLQEIFRQALGIELVLENVDFATRLQKMRDGDFDLVFAGWGADYNDPLSFLELWVTDGPYNDVGWSNAEFDELISIARSSTDQEERMEALAKAEKILLDEAPIIPVYWRQRNYAEHPWVKGIIRSAVFPANEWKWAYTEGRPGGDNVLNLNLGEEPPDLQSITCTDAVSMDILNATLEGLVRMNANGEYEQGSGLAESWTISDDGLVYTFELKEGLKWSNGEPLTAHDFEYAWKKVVDPRTASQYNYMMFFVKGAEAVANVEIPDKESDPEGYEQAMAELQEAMDNMGVKALDDLTLEVTLEAPSAFFLSLTAFSPYFPLNQAAHEQWGEEYATEPDKMLYCGPFVIDEWKHGSKMVLKKNPNYWDADNVKLEQINLDMIKDINTPVTMYEAKELDVIGVPGDFIPKFQAERPDEFKQMPEAVTFYLECNLNHPLLKDQRVRQALSLALDRQEYCDNVLRNYSAPAYAYNPPSISSEEPSVPFVEKYLNDYLPINGDVEKAREIFKAAVEALGYEAPEPPTK
ncbi:MAG: ABC transporter substrate-binding protein [Bacillota bacterium]